MEYATTYDPDTVQFPLAKPKIRLSVSEDKYEPHTGLLVPFDIYAERFDLTSVLRTEINAQTSRAEVGIYTYNLNVSGNSGGCGFALPGSDGGSKHKDGFNGGDLNLYVEQLMPSTAKALTFLSTGGRGYSPPDQVGVKGQDGGNGGNGGHVKILFDTLYTSAGDTAGKICGDLLNSHMKWPADFKSDASTFVGLLAEPEVKASGFLDTLPQWAKTVPGILNAGRREFMVVAENLYNAVGGDRSHMQGDLTQAVNIHYGDRGFGSTGEGVTGKDGDHGQPGQRLVQPLQNVAQILQTDVCFAHPFQCQMMLAKVDLLRFSGTREDLASAVAILDRLVHRLQVFADVQKSPEPPLWAAYRKSAERLFTVENGPSTVEPYAIRRLRAIRTEAATTKQKILSGEAFAGLDADKVPRLSFKSYQDTAEHLLVYLKDAESLFLQYLGEDKKTTERLANVTERSNVLAKAAQLNDELISEAKADITQTNKKIGFSVDAIAKAKQALLDSMKHLEDFVHKQFGVTFHDFVEAMNSVLFTGGSGAMAALQTASLLDKGTEDLLRDDRVPVTKKYLIQKLHDLEGGVKDLTEKYKVLRDGHVDLDDPGAEKILVAEKTWETLVGDFRQSIPAEDYNDVKKKFKEFYDVVQQRNSAVLHYNATLTLLLNCLRKREQLQLDRVDITREEYNNLDAGHPAMTGFLRKTYRENVYSAQIWLYKQQQALRFLALKKVADLNIIGKELHDTPYSQLNHETLERIQTSLYTAYNQYLDDAGKDEQTRTKARVYLSHDDAGYIGSRHPEEDVVLTPLTVQLDDPIFSEAYDVRLLTVRFYAVGAKPIITGDQDSNKKQDNPSDRELQVMITHTGTEKFKDHNGKPIEFTHRPITVLFRYAVDTGVISSDGQISLENHDTYARVGPFTKWRVEITRNSNKHIDLTPVKEAYLEFDFKYKALDSGR
ncbi:hypothetical protein AARAC_001875 [Aspergillus arachidicola]|uniref:Serine protein kinase n=1 Tax=Aspergillus arachidicola TaxID=656916 RepID=A0A2G7GB51_9EURO|nr:hypothetical protein AARAC_001875 [Aspergillus arachidicola]